MGHKLILKKHEHGKGLIFGPVSFLADGSLKVQGRTIEMKTIPETGFEVAGVMLLRSGTELIAIKSKGRFICLTYTLGCWYYGQQASR
jgi:hypothetical protein